MSFWGISDDALNALAKQKASGNSTTAYNKIAGTSTNQNATPAYNAAAGNPAAANTAPAGGIFGPGSAHDAISGNNTIPAPTAPVAPAAPAAMTPEQIAAAAKKQVDSDTTAGTAYANSVLPDGTLSRLGTDPEVKAYLEQLKGRTGGMTPAELRAQYEQGTSSSDAELATNLQRAGRIAGNAGVRGGAAAGLQAGALNHSIDQQAALQRQMVLDNIAQKNSAFAAYGNDLMGVAQNDAGQSDKEKIGRLSLAEQKGGQYDSARTGIKSDISAQKSVDQSTAFNNSLLNKLGGSSSTATPDRNTAQTSTTTSGIEKTIGDLYGARKQELGGAGAIASQFDSSKPTAITSGINEYLANAYPDLSQTEQAQKADAITKGTKIQDILGIPINLKDAEKGDDLLKTLTPEQAQKYSKVMMNRQVGKPDSATIICTEAMRQGMFERAFYARAENSAQIIGYTTMKAYHTWGRHVVAAMRKSTVLTSAIAWFLPDTVKAIHGQPHKFRGDVGYAVFQTLNTLVKMSRRSIMRAA